MEEITIGSDVDRISDLPSNVIDQILGFLPLKDAVRTTTLSTKWKDKWHSVPHVIFDEKMFKSGRRKLEGLVNYILTTHEGRIKKFSVSVEVRDSYNMKSWIRRVSQKGVEELSLLYQRGSENKMPTILFSCQQLRKLSLRRCVVKPSHFFTGFPCLISLQLDKINIETAAFEKLISSCPLLEQLTLRKLSCDDHLNINVPKLNYFCFDGEFISLCFNTPLLEVLSINLFRIKSFRNDSQFYLRFKFSSLPSAIKELYVRCEFQKYLAGCDTFTEVVTFSHLRTLGINQFCFEKADQVLCLLSLIGSSANLTVLDIAGCGCESEAASEHVAKFWEEQNNGPLILNQLRKVRVKSFHGKDLEMKFIQFVMANSPTLEEMTIEYMENPEFDEHEVKEVLQGLCKASTELKFIATKPESRNPSIREDSHSYYVDDMYDGYREDSD